MKKAMVSGGNLLTSGCIVAFYFAIFNVCASGVSICTPGFGFPAKQTCFCLTSDGQPTGTQVTFSGSYQGQCQCPFYSLCAKGPAAVNKPTSAQNCLPCCPNWFSDISQADESCRACPTNLWSTVHLGQGASDCSTCKLTVCGIGLYQPPCSSQSQQSSCVPCINPNSKHSTFTSNGTVDGVCQWTCDSGYFLSVNGTCTECTTSPCPNSMVRTNCTPTQDGICYYPRWVTENATKYCPEGTSGPDNVGPCVECEAGKYKDIPGSSSCQACPINSNSTKGSVSLADCSCEAGTKNGAGINRGPCAKGGQCSVMLVDYLSVNSYLLPSSEEFVSLAKAGSASNILIENISDGQVRKLPMKMADALNSWNSLNPLLSVVKNSIVPIMFDYSTNDIVLSGLNWIFGVANQDFLGIVALGNDGTMRKLAGTSNFPSTVSIDGFGSNASFQNPFVLKISENGVSIWMDDAGDIRNMDMRSAYVQTIVSFSAVNLAFEALYGRFGGIYGFYGWKCFEVFGNYLYASATISTPFCKTCIIKIPLNGTKQQRDSNIIILKEPSSGSFATQSFKVLPGGDSAVLLSFDTGEVFVQRLDSGQRELIIGTEKYNLGNNASFSGLRLAVTLNGELWIILSSSSNSYAFRAGCNMCPNSAFGDFNCVFGANQTFVNLIAATTASKVTTKGQEQDSDLVTVAFTINLQLNMASFLEGQATFMAAVGNALYLSKANIMLVSIKEIPQSRRLYSTRTLLSVSQDETIIQAQMKAIISNSNASMVCNAIQDPAALQSVLNRTGFAVTSVTIDPSTQSCVVPRQTISTSSNTSSMMTAIAIASGVGGLLLVMTIIYMLCRCMMQKRRHFKGQTNVRQGKQGEYSDMPLHSEGDVKEGKKHTKRMAVEQTSNPSASVFIISKDIRRLSRDDRACDEKKGLSDAESLSGASSTAELTFDTSAASTAKDSFSKGFTTPITILSGTQEPQRTNPGVDQVFSHSNPSGIYVEKTDSELLFGAAEISAPAEPKTSDYIFEVWKRKSELQSGEDRSAAKKSDLSKIRSEAGNMRICAGASSNILLGGLEQPFRPALQSSKIPVVDEMTSEKQKHIKHALEISSGFIGAALPAPPSRTSPAGREISLGAPCSNLDDLYELYSEKSDMEDGSGGAGMARSPPTSTAGVARRSMAALRAGQAAEVKDQLSPRLAALRVSFEDRFRRQSGSFSGRVGGDAASPRGKRP